MPLPLSTDARDKISAREISSAWFLDLYTDGTTLRCWNQHYSFDEGGNTYEGLGDQWKIEGEISSGANLVPEPLVVYFDGAHQLDDTSFIGRLLDSKWHNREIRIRQFVFTPLTGHRVGGTVVMEWNGSMQTISAADGGSGVSQVVLNCESGTFKALARNMQTITDVNQRQRAPLDGSFANMATKQKEQIPFGIGWHAVPGISNNSGSNSGGNSGGNSGHPRWRGIGS